MLITYAKLKFIKYMVEYNFCTESKPGKTFNYYSLKLFRLNGQRNLPLGCIAVAHSSIVFARLRHCAPPSDTRFLVPTGVYVPNGISIGSAVFYGSRS